MNETCQWNLDAEDGQHLMKAADKKELLLPWDISVLFNTLCSYDNNWMMSLKHLSRKTYLLLVLAMAWHPGSDMGHIPAWAIKDLARGTRS